MTHPGHMDLPLRILIAKVLAFHVSTKVERHKGNASSDPFWYHGHDFDPDAFGTFDPDLFSITNAKIVCIRSVDFDEHVLLQFSQPGVDRVSSPPPSYSTSRPDVRIIG